MSERLPVNLDQRTIGDDYPEGFGEAPGPTAGEILHINKKVRNPEDLPVQVGRFGPLRRKISELRSHGLSVGVQFAGPRQVRIFVAEHPDLIKRTAAAAVGIAGGVAAAGVIYLHKHHQSK